MKFYARNFILNQLFSIVASVVILFVCYKVIRWLVKDYKAEKAAYGRKAALKKHTLHLVVSVGATITLLFIFIYGTMTQFYGYYEIKNNQIKAWYINPFKSTQYVKISDIKAIELDRPNSSKEYQYIITKNNEKIFIATWIKNNDDDDLYTYINRNYNIPSTVKDTND